MPSMPTIPRFHCSCTLGPQARVELPEAIAHHAVRVLRLRDGADVVLFDGRGGEYPAVLEVAGKSAYARLGEQRMREAELAGAITLVQGLPGGDKMDWIVEKAVELGACRVAPIQADRSVAQLSGARLDKRMAHWRRISVAASEQCGRNRIMEVDEPCSLRQWLAGSDMASSLTLLCHPEADDDLAGALRAAGRLDSVRLLIGPEGGWSDNELDDAARAGLRQVRYGPRVLRTETAGLALISACTALLGW
jgi:16S rRNA (uracil1498-N3)-methyltransferase